MLAAVVKPRVPVVAEPRVSPLTKPVTVPDSAGMALPCVKLRGLAK